MFKKNYSETVPETVNFNKTIADERKFEEKRLHFIVEMGNKINYETYSEFCEKNSRKAPETKEAYKVMIKDYKNALKTKIKNYASKWGMSAENIRYSIAQDKLFARNFIVDPIKRTFHQHKAAEYIKSLPVVTNFHELNNTGNKSWFVRDGGLLRGKNTKGMMTNMKSIDFSWNYRFKNKKLSFFASHKFTNEDGGAQTEQYSDICNFLLEAMKNRNGDVMFLSITDGDFYKKSHSRKGYTKLEQMRTYFNGENCYSTTCETLLKDMTPIIKKWLIKNFKADEIKDELENLSNLESVLQ